MNDKALHFIFGVALAFIVMWLSGSMVAASFAAIAAGAIKEVHDLKYGGVVDGEDFVMTVLGGAVVLVAWSLV